MSLYKVPDHPTIKNMELSGYPDGKAPEVPVCPVCGRECGYVFCNRDDEIVGCDECIKEINAWDTPECFPSRKEQL